MIIVWFFFVSLFFFNAFFSSIVIHDLFLYGIVPVVVLLLLSDKRCSRKEKKKKENNNNNICASMHCRRLSSYSLYIPNQNLATCTFVFKEQQLPYLIAIQYDSTNRYLSIASIIANNATTKSVETTWHHGSSIRTRH